MNTRHARVRAQQRGMPPIVGELLDDYGAEQYDGHGGVVVYLNKKSRRMIKRALGPRAVAHLHERLRDPYKVRAIDDGRTVTIGHRKSHIRRR
jgi:hypothetical protein